jgi:hypothetical protein
MSKATVTRLFVGGIVAVAAGIALVLAAVWVAFAGNVFVMDGPDVVGLKSGTFSWTMILLGLVGVLAVTGGAIAGLVSWIGALMNTAQLDDKAWFVVLLVLGLLSFGFVAMVVYVVAGPDATLQVRGGTPRARTGAPA